MDYRVDTQQVDERQRRAIRYSLSGHRTPASRAECAAFAEAAIQAAIAAAEVPYDAHMALVEKARQAEAAKAKAKK